MKWFRHETDSYTNLKLRHILLEFGLEAYGFYWICLELVGQQGVGYRINAEKNWQKLLEDISKLPSEKIVAILNKLAEFKLICQKSLQRGDLFIPKMKDYSDEYTKRLRRYSEESAIKLDNITLHNITKHYITLKGFDEKTLQSSDWGRYGSCIKKLLLRSKGEAGPILEGLDWLSKQDYEWTMETLVKKWSEFMKYKSIPDLLKKFGKKDKL